MSKKISPAKPIEIQVNKPVILSGPVLTFLPVLAHLFDNDLHGIVYSQLCYISREKIAGQEERIEKRISLTRLQRMLPFVSRRWLINVLKSLEESEYVHVERTGRVNVYIPIASVERVIKAFQKAHPSAPEYFFSNYMICPLLANEIGLKQAIVLQQIHLRCHKHDGAMFFIRSLEDWQTQTFPFWSSATVNRIFKNLREHNLIIVKPYKREDEGFVNSYRVNYLRLAELLALPLPEIQNPFEEKKHDHYVRRDWLDWTNPVTQVKQADMKNALTT